MELINKSKQASKHSCQNTHHHHVALIKSPWGGVTHGQCKQTKQINNNGHTRYSPVISQEGRQTGRPDVKIVQSNIVLLYFHHIY
jgi:hypothetical protein